MGDVWRSRRASNTDGALWKARLRSETLNTPTPIQAVTAIQFFFYTDGQMIKLSGAIRLPRFQRQVFEPSPSTGLPTEEARFRRVSKDSPRQSFAATCQ